MNMDLQQQSETQAVVDELMDQIVAVEAVQDEDGPAMQLTQLVGVDIRDIQDHLDANGGYDPYDVLGDLADTASWLAAYRAEHPALVEKLTTLLDAAAATIGHTL
jgi:hypothetical protein